MDYYRSKYHKYNKVSVPIEDTELFHEDDISSLIEYREEAEKIIKIINTFDSFMQQIFRLKVFREYTFKEISKMFDIPESTVKTKYYSMVKKIKKLCKE